MCKKITAVVTGAIILSLCHLCLAHAFKIAVHEQITRRTIDYIKPSLNIYFNNIGLDKGVNTEFNKRLLREWVERGSKEEDEPLWQGRYLRHFYNPLDGSGLGIYESSYEWASGEIGSINEWSWRKARTYYYKGLTLSSDNERQTAFADASSHWVN